MEGLAKKYLRPEKYPGTSCRGCGLRLAQRRILQAIDELELAPEDIIWGTGIGCAGRQTYATWKGDNFAGTHGRVYAIATGLRLALPEAKKIILTVGDGDAFTIGLAHLLNCARRNVDLTVIVCDNLGYQSTGGQYSMTTPDGSLTDSSPYGMWEQNWTQNGLEIMGMLQAAGSTFLARHTVLEERAAVESLKKALVNKGFSLVQLIYPCVTHFGEQALHTKNIAGVYRWFREQTASIGATSAGVLFQTGIYHDTSNGRPEFAERLREYVAGIQRRPVDVETD